MNAAVYEFQDGQVWPANALGFAEIERRFGKLRRQFVQMSAAPLRCWPDGYDYIVRMKRTGDRVKNEAAEAALQEA